MRLDLLVSCRGRQTSRGTLKRTKECMTACSNVIKQTQEQQQDHARRKERSTSSATETPLTPWDAADAIYFRQTDREEAYQLQSMTFNL